MIRAAVFHRPATAVLGVLMALLVCQTASAQSSAERGKAKSKTCAACHGADGNSIDPQYPRLAGQYNLYLQQALHEYKDGRRKNAIMVGFAGALSDQDIEDISEFYATLPGKMRTLQGEVQGDR